LADCITYVGLDVHKEWIVVAVAEGGGRGEVREYGRIANTTVAVERLVRKLGHEGVELRLCYEAGPCGYGIQRQLSTSGHDCVVVAPSLIPKRAGDRVKTDRRDAASLARLHRAGELTAVWVPDAGHEAMRDLVRARLDAVQALRRARQQLSGFLLRQARHYRRPAWTKLHRRWIAGLKFEQAAHHLVLEDYIAAVETTATRRGPPAADRGGLVLPLSGAGQPRTAAPARGTAQADPRDRLEGSAAALCPLSQARAHRQARQCRHRRDRPRAGRLCVGHRSAHAAGGELTEQAA